MSHYTQVAVQIKSVEALKAALAELGYCYDVIEEHEVAQPLYGYHGDLRPEKAHIIVRRKFVGSASNDLGFRREADGRWTVIVSDYDQGLLRRQHQLGPAGWAGKVTQLAGVHAALAVARLRGLKAERRTDAQGRLQVVIQARA